MKIPSRTRGQTEVYRGPSCPNGHDGVRYRSTGQCVECKRESGRKGSTSRGSLSDAVRKQERWVESFEKNFNDVSSFGILKVLSSKYHKTPLQGWLYRMRSYWNDHPADRKARLISLGEQKWWLRVDPPRHQTRTGFQVGSPEYKKYKRTVNKEWRKEKGEKIREDARAYYQTHPKHREKASAARRKRFEENPGLAAYLTSLRRKREKVQRCSCCSNNEFRAVYLKHASLGFETDHKISLAIAIELGLKGKHCISNLQGLTQKEHRKKTSADISKLAAIRRSKNIAYHKTANKIKRVTRFDPMKSST